MAEKTGINRRDFMASTAAVAGMSTTAVAATPELGDTPVVVTNWARTTHAEMSSLIGQRFHVTAPDGRTGILELVDAEPVSSGPDRPADLPRAEGVVAVFDSLDKDFFVGAEHSMHRVSHVKLGTANLFMGRSPKRSGGDVIEMVLN